MKAFASPSISLSESSRSQALPCIAESVDESGCESSHSMRAEQGSPVPRGLVFLNSDSPLGQSPETERLRVQLERRLMVRLDSHDSNSAASDTTMIDAAPTPPTPRAPASSDAHPFDPTQGPHIELRAAIRNHELTTVVRFVRQTPFRIDDRDETGRTALHHAVECGNFDIARTLLLGLQNVRADVNARTHFGLTPLHCAAVLGRPQITQMLVCSRGQINALTDFGASVLDMARHGRQVGLAQALQSYGAVSSGRPWRLNATQRARLETEVGAHGVVAVAAMLWISPARLQALLQDDEGPSAMLIDQALPGRRNARPGAP